MPDPVDPFGTSDQPESAPPTLVQFYAGSRVGPYKLLQKLGEGGMGAVWMAEQSEPVRRLVALKLIRPDRAHDHFLARFEAERQALALMDHPNIAKVLDAGLAPLTPGPSPAGGEGRQISPFSPGGRGVGGEGGGLPYLAMELVKGIPITKYCDDTRLTIRERVELFIPVCRAVQHAHTKGIIHRDLKPSNVLVALYDGVAVPKVIDFGVAKALHQKLTERTMITEFGAVVGTPEYMAPEQAEFNALDIDTRADVYSLGVILYELLAGSPPFSRKRLEGAALLEILRLIKEVEPPTPSKRLSSENTLPEVAAKRKTEPQKLGRLLRGELDWIVMRAMEKERGRRYGTAEALGADLERFVRDEPVLARPPSAAYRLRKFARKYTGQLVAAGLLLATLFVAVVVSLTLLTWALRAEAERQTELENVTAAQNEALTEKQRADERAEVALKQQVRADDEAAAAKANAAEVTRLLSAANVQLAISHWKEGNAPLARAALNLVAPEHRHWEWGYLQKETQGGYAVLYGHTKRVKSVAFSPDASRMASADASGMIRVWDARTGVLAYTLNDGLFQIRGVAFSPDGTRLAACGDFNTVRVCDARLGTTVQSLAGHTAGVTSVAFSPDGDRLASAGEDGTVRLWDPRTGAAMQTLAGHTGEVTSVAFGPDGGRLASAGKDGTVRLWDPRTGAAMQTLVGHTGGITSVAFSPDGGRVASASYGQTVRVWNARTGAAMQTLVGHTGGITSVAFSPDGSRLASVSDDQTMRVWDVRTGATVQTLIGHTDGINSVAFSPDGSRLASASDDHTVRLWDARTGPAVLTFGGRSTGGSLAFSPDGSRLASGGADNTVRILDSRSGASVQTLTGHTDEINSVAFSRDGSRLASGGADNTVRIWDPRSGAAVQTLTGHTGRINSLAFSPDGSRLASGGADNTIRIWDPRSGPAVQTLTGHTDEINSVAFSPDGSRLASGGADNTVRIWDPHSGAAVQSLTGHGSTARYPMYSGVKYVMFSPDGTRLASGGADNTVRIWDTRSGTVVQTLNGHSGSAPYSIIEGVNCVVFSPDGTRLASGAGDGTVKLWDERTGTAVVTLSGDNVPVTSLAFSPDGASLASVGFSENLRVWSARTGTAVLTLQGHTGRITEVAFSRDGRRLASAGIDNTVRIWDAQKGVQLQSWPAMVRKTNDRDYDLLQIRFDRSGTLLGARSEFDRANDRNTRKDMLKLGSKFMLRPFRVYDIASGKPVERWRLLEFDVLRDPELRPDGDAIAIADGNVVLIVDLRTPTDWELDFRRAKARPDPWWQEQQARERFGQGRWFAASFHDGEALKEWSDRNDLRLRRSRTLLELGRISLEDYSWARGMAGQLTQIGSAIAVIAASNRFGSVVAAASLSGKSTAEDSLVAARAALTGNDRPAAERLLHQAEQWLVDSDPWTPDSPRAATISGGRRFAIEDLRREVRQGLGLPIVPPPYTD